MEIPFLNRVSAKDKAFMARQLATMISSGLTIDKALRVLRSQMKGVYVQNILSQVEKDIENGKTFSDSLKKFPKVFDQVFVNIIVSGEAVGKLADVLNRLADQLEEQNAFMSKIKSALYYPIFVVAIMFVIVILMMVYVIPPLKDVFAEFETQLPWTTKALLSLSNFVATNWLITIGIIVVIIVFIVWFVKTKQGKEIIDRIAIEFTGGLAKDIYMARFSRTMAMLIQAGTPIIDAIKITGQVMNNIIYQRVLTRTVSQIERGVPMSVQLEKSKYFPVIIPQMISVGEKTGKLENVLENLAKYFEQESDAKVKGITGLFEPILMIIIGIGVAFIVFSIIMPIYQIAQIG